MSKRWTNVTVTEDLDEQLDAYIKAQSPSPSISAVIREAVAEFLNARGFSVEDVHPQRGGDWSRRKK